MSVYVDDLFNYGGSATFRWTTSCHMFADDLDELHAMAAMIGMKFAWFQDHDLPHYDLTPSRRALAVKKGVVQVHRNKALARLFIKLRKSRQRKR